MNMLSEYFDSRDAGEFLEMWCKGCNRGWRWPKEKTSGRDLLPLTNHARKHLPRVKLSSSPEPRADEPELPFREAKVLPVRRHTRGRSKGKKAAASARRKKSKAA